VFVTASSGANQDRLHVLCFEAASGKKLWERQFWATGRTFCHPTSAIAAPTPASDGQHVFAFYSSNDLACLDLDGNLKWFRGLTYDFPTAANDVGMSSSPIVAGKLVIVQVESKGDSFAAGIDTATGLTHWRVDRPQEMNWCSPALVPGKTPAEDLLLLQSPTELTAHDPQTGRLLWTFKRECDGIPSSVGRDGMIFLPSKGLTGLRVQPGQAEPEVVWDESKLGGGNASPVVHGDRVYSLNRVGALAGADAATGKVDWRVRIKGTYWATPVEAGGNLYCANYDGLVTVVKVGTDAEIVGESSLGEPVLGSPAIVDGAMYLRSDKHLWKIAAK
jgi:outer membrane protein assembly factor BamB